MQIIDSFIDDKPSWKDIIKIKFEESKHIIVPYCVFLILFVALSEPNISPSNTMIQTGGGMTSPIASTFNMVLNAVSQFFRFILLILTIIMIPAVPILLYCLIAYYVIRKTVLMFTTLK